MAWPVTQRGVTMRVEKIWLPAGEVERLYRSMGVPLNVPAGWRMCGVHAGELIKFYQAHGVDPDPIYYTLYDMIYLDHERCISEGVCRRCQHELDCQCHECDCHCHELV